LELVNRKLLSENNRLKKDKDHYHRIWVDEHAESLKYKETISTLSTKLADLDSRVYIGESVLQKDEEIATKFKDQLKEYKIDASKLKAELQRVRTDCQASMTKNVCLAYK